VIGIFIGRFQPFHLGHLDAIRWICKRVELLYIVVSESHNGDTESNPYSRVQREQMIKNSLDAGGIRNYQLVYVPDFDTVDEWVDAIRKQAPDFDTVFTGNPWVDRCFKARGFAVEHQPQFQPERFNATRIRRMIAEDGPWQGLVPKATTGIIKRRAKVP
jgi:nicotinamide-nucleotide adenylyltransferase